VRKGQNPAKNGLQAYRPAQLGVMLVIYIPTQSGYFSDSLEIFKIQLASLHKNTPTKFNILVFDNGSCRVVQDTLQKMQTDGLIDWLTLSRHNLGKTGALNWGIRAMPNELICYSDGDVYFRPGWYEQSLNILETFPLCGIVTAQPCYFDSLAGKGKAYFSLQGLTHIEMTSRQADVEATEEYVRSIGDNPELRTRYANHEWQIVRNPIKNVEAVIGASHFQFLAHKSMLEQIIPLPAIYGLNREDDYQIISRIDQMGFLQLSTVTPFVYHMGNQMDESIVKENLRDHLNEVLNNELEVPSMTNQNQITLKKKISFWLLHQIARLPFFKLLVQRFYNLLFEYYARVK
jgi:glycosyltransferase involved in cell wall biosynthesis